MTFKRYRIIFILIFMFMSSTFGDQTTKQHMTDDEKTDKKEGRALFPRIEYSNEWQPVGRGDPLKDPTYDYMPPVLDRVRYWGEGPSHRNKNDILLLGVTSKKSPSNKQKEKNNFGPIKRTYYSPTYQQHSLPHLNHPHQKQQLQQYLPQRLMPPPMHVTDSYSSSTNNHQHQRWKTPESNAYTETRLENTVNYVMSSRPFTTPLVTMNMSSGQFLPTISPLDRSQEQSPTSPTLPMSTQPTIKHNGSAINGLMTPSRVEQTENAQSLLQSILQTETASPFTKRPSDVYQIEYNSNIYNPEAINSMAISSSHVTTSSSTKPTNKPSRATTISNIVSSSPTSFVNVEEKKQYFQPEMTGWPLHNLIIEGHSKVKTYGLKNDDPIENNLPKIRPVQAKDNPIVERITKDQRPEYTSKHRKEDIKLLKPSEGGNSAITNLLSFLDNSFSNFLSVESDVKVLESENKNTKMWEGNSNKQKMRRSVPDENKQKQERTVNVSFYVKNNKIQETYRKGTVISENLWP